VTASLVASGFLFCQFIRRTQPYAVYLALTYLLVYSVPFIVVNGLLTGSWLHVAVVWYDNAQNLWLRLLTIPAEDFIYGLALLSMNVARSERYRLLPIKKGSS